LKADSFFFKNFKTTAIGAPQMKTPFLSALALAACFALSQSASAQQKVSFEGKSIKMILPTTSGGSTDIAARLFARFLAKYLPGAPAIVVQNMPGGHGVNALNFLAQQAKPDGLTMLLSSNSEVDPIVFRTPQAHYDPAKFEIIGGLGFGDNIMIIRTDALPRLLDKSKPPVAMGSVTGAPRSGMRMTIWGADYLGWNTKWVTGYPGSPDLVLAMERGEIDMTSFPRFYVKDKLLDQSKYKIIYLDGLNKNARPSGRPDADSAPKFVDAMEGKIKDPKIMAAYDYWRASTLFKWMALPPGTPANIRDAYRDAFKKMVVDPEFTAQADQVLEGYTILSTEETIKTIKDLALTSDEALQTMDSLLPKL
jgi:tripartite-type tricarboxylate transporter receptor subunit TctC